MPKKSDSSLTGKSKTVATSANKSRPVAVGSVLTAEGFVIPDAKHFPNGYDLRAAHVEFEKLAQMGGLVAFEQETHPRHAELVEYQQQMMIFTAAATEAQNRREADSSVQPSMAKRIDTMGGLKPQGQDTMSVQSIDAMRVFIGTSRMDAQGIRTYIPSVPRIATAFQKLFLLTANDNPYADFHLLLATTELQVCTEFMQTKMKELNALLDVAKASGLNYSQFANAKPAVVSISFSSPYGYTLCELVVCFDSLVRLATTCQRRNLMTVQQRHSLLLKAKGKIRAAFYEIEKNTKHLVTSELTSLSRADWQESAPAIARGRVAAVREFYGDVPPTIFRGDQLPPHSLGKTRAAMFAREGLAAAAAEAQAEEAAFLEAQAERKNAVPGGDIGQGVVAVGLPVNRQDAGAGGFLSGSSELQQGDGDA